MPDATMKRCPQCGQRTTNLELAQCPYCRVALVVETGVPGAGLTREQARMLARQILGSWKLWAVIIVLVAAGAWGVVQVSQRIMDARSKAYLSDLETKATNRLAVASAEIAKQVSNQIQAELRQPRVQAAMEQMARERVSEAMSNSLWPSLEEFQRSLYRASSQLARSTNELAKLDKDIKAAETKVAEAKVPQPAAAVAAPSAQPPAAAKAPAPSTGGATKLTMSTQTVMQNGQNYLLTIFFKPTSQTAIGPVSLIAGTFKQTARIANFVLVTPGQSQPMMLNETQDAAQLQFNVAGGDAPAVAIELTAPTIVRVTGDALAEELTLPVSADKMTLPALTR
jgi:hypothetical protein